MTRDDDERIADILDAIRRLDEIVAEGREAFESSHVLLAAALYNIQVIGEASSQLTETAREQHPDVPWRQIIGMRNFVVHRYFETEAGVVWETATTHVKQLREQLKD